MKSDHPFLIVGQGLAGTAMAWRLKERGVPFLIVDPNLPQTCSKVAAGLVTPITGMRLNLSWRVAELLPEAMSFYQGLECELDQKFYHQVPYVRLFSEDREVALWQKRRLDPLVAAYVAGEKHLADEQAFRTELGGFRQRHSGWLDTIAYLEASRLSFQSIGGWQQDEVLEDDIQIDGASFIWQGNHYSHVILCRGWEQSRSRFFSWLPFNAARGVMADLNADIPSSEIINRRGWLLPHKEGRFRAGSTYEFDFDRPLDDSIHELHGKLQSLLRVPFTLTNPRVGVRPIIKRLPAVMGRHPTHNNLVVLNGLGSKGAMKSPTLSRHLVSHLLDGTLLDAALDIRANF